jgi:hypothetical protein
MFGSAMFSGLEGGKEEVSCGEATSGKALNESETCGLKFDSVS